MKETKKEKKAKELLKLQKYTLEEIAKITRLDIARVKALAKKMWKVDKEKDLKEFIELKYVLKAQIRVIMREKHGFYR